MTTKIYTQLVCAKCTSPDTWLNDAKLYEEADMCSSVTDKGSLKHKDSPNMLPSLQSHIKNYNIHSSIDIEIKCGVIRSTPP